MSRLSRVVAPWLSSNDSDHLIVLRDHLIWLQQELFRDYEPNRYQSFDDRVANWLENLISEEDRKSLFCLLEHVFFVGKQQFDALCRAAFSDVSARWIIDAAPLDIEHPALGAALQDAARETWFCPLTDSMRINSFLKLNRLEGHGRRPDWRSMEAFGDVIRLRHYVERKGIKRLVLLEDFVGSGNQMESTVRWAASALQELPILVIPLVCCPSGAEMGQSLDQLLPNVTFAPVLSLRPELFLCQQPQPQEPDVFSRVRQIIVQVRNRMDKWESQPFGYEATGALVALYSNCPDNTLPIFHHDGPDWAPLFPRIDRS